MALLSDGATGSRRQQIRDAGCRRQIPRAF